MVSHLRKFFYVWLVMEGMIINLVIKFAVLRMLDNGKLPVRCLEKSIALVKLMSCINNSANISL